MSSCAGSGAVPLLGCCATGPPGFYSATVFAPAHGWTLSFGGSGFDSFDLADRIRKFATVTFHAENYDCEGSVLDGTRTLDPDTGAISSTGDSFADWFTEYSTAPAPTVSRPSLTEFSAVRACPLGGESVFTLSWSSEIDYAAVEARATAALAIAPWVASSDGVAFNDFNLDIAGVSLLTPAASLINGSRKRKLKVVANGFTLPECLETYIDGVTTFAALNCNPQCIILPPPSDPTLVERFSENSMGSQNYRRYRHPGSSYVICPP